MTGAGLRATVGTTIMVLVAVALAGCGSGSDSNGKSATTASLECAWPMFGRTPAHTFAADPACANGITRETVPALAQKWFHETADVVSAAPALADGTAYVGDWAGNFFALSLDDGTQRWSFKAEEHPTVYAGQIVASAAVADAGGERRVYFAAGKTVYALDTAKGQLRWKHQLNPGGGSGDPTEIQSSPVVVGNTVIVGYDSHDAPGVRAGIIALNAANGDVIWDFDPDQGKPPSGCGGVWSSPTVDEARGLVFAGGANCPTSPEGWIEYSEAIYAIDLATGAPRWSFQPRGPSNNDFDFAGAPNLFEAGGRALVGLGGKDGTYYALDRERGELVWKAQATSPQPVRRNFSTGGFIGATAVGDGRVVGGTAVDGGCPCLHGIDTTNGTVAWTQKEAGPTFAPSMIVNDVAFSGSTTDFTLRAVDVRNGELLWSQELSGGVSGGAAVVGDTVVIGVGIREPGVPPSGTGTGVYAFAPNATGPGTSVAASNDTLPPTTVAGPPLPVPADAPETPKCVARPCSLQFTLKNPPAGTQPAMTVWLRPEPFRIEVRAEDLGPPDGWLRPDSSASKKGAVTYAAFASDDSQQGSLLCILDGNFDCLSETLPQDLRPNYNRITILAIANSTKLPSVAEGFDRLVTTVALDESVVLK